MDYYFQCSYLFSRRGSKDFLVKTKHYFPNSRVISNVLNVQSPHLQESCKKFIPIFCTHSAGGKH